MHLHKGLVLAAAAFTAAGGLAVAVPAQADPATSVAVQRTQSESAFRFPGSYRWLPEHFSGPCITAHGGVHKGAKVDQYRCVGASNQKWHVETLDAYHAYRIHPAQNMGLCVDMPGNYRKGTQLVLWNCNGRTNQSFSFHCGSGQRHCQIKPYSGAHHDKCLSVKGGKTANNTPLILWRCNGARDQKFTFR
ncbi:RICIN domain-containing protein [Streptomyces odontomachi]|uniref:RICIN domain-containing protein n=1 Tax=Streptomyces odontomachi TaxID=2944940 RepID=UPI00210AF0C7|nr:RICIN domain-containing protein [Streptomyces sp. ODS25]